VIERLRVYAKTPLIAGSLLGLYATWRALIPPMRKVGLERAWRRTMMNAWASSSLRILGIRVTVEGKPPSGPGLLVANHLTYLDIALLGARHDCVFVSMAEVSGWPIMGRIARDADTVFIDRARRSDAARVVEEIADRIANGYTVIVFPEGKSGDGQAVNPFHAPLLEPAARLGAPVSWVALGYRTQPGDPPAATAVCWSEAVTFGEHMLRLMRLGRIDARLAYGSQPITEPDRKRLATRLEAAVRSAFVPCDPVAASREPVVLGR
jgi:1-acyl-sn-glycerol-3-phosphate acyltransferase